jgi:ankyrin repeat protein
MSTAEDMMAAVKAGDLTRVNALMEADPALVNARDTEGNSAILIATYWGKRDVASALLAHKPELNVFEAAATGQLERLRQLVDADPALIHAWSHDGFTSLHLAVFFGQREVVDYLLPFGPDINAISRNSMHVQPLHSAAAGNRLDICRVLIEHGAGVNARQEGGFTPLMEAAQNGNGELVALLLAHGADADAAAENGKTAVDFAQEGGHADVARLLANAVG